MPKGRKPNGLNPDASKTLPGEKGVIGSVTTVDELSQQFERLPFDKEMEELGVEVIKPKKDMEFVPFKAGKKAPKQKNTPESAPLKHGLCVLNKSWMSFPDNLYKEVEGKYIRFGQLKAGRETYLAFRIFDANKENCVKVKSTGKQKRLVSGTKQLVDQIVAAGFKLGIYSPGAVKGGYVLTLVKAKPESGKKKASAQSTTRGSKDGR
ncbi:MAG: hypothetical protein FH749_06865 [Firmicutes bacterium]|nr:hypothetical protein [Bacillota bacterium]